MKINSSNYSFSSKVIEIWRDQQTPRIAKVALLVFSVAFLPFVLLFEGARYLAHRVKPIPVQPTPVQLTPVTKEPSLVKSAPSIVVPEIPSPREPVVIPLTTSPWKTALKIGACVLGIGLLAYGASQIFSAATAVAPACVMGTASARDLSSSGWLKYSCVPQAIIDAKDAILKGGASAYYSLGKHDKMQCVDLENLGRTMCTVFSHSENAKSTIPGASSYIYFPTLKEAAQLTSIMKPYEACKMTELAVFKCLHFVQNSVEDIKKMCGFGSAIQLAGCTRKATDLLVAQIKKLNFSPLFS